MATRPTTTLPHFATDTGKRATLTSTRQDTGMNPGEVLGGLDFNAVVGPALDWAGYLAELSPVSNTLGSDTSTTLTLQGSTVNINAGPTTTSRVQLSMTDDSVVFLRNFTTPESLLAFDDSYGWAIGNFGLVVAGVTADDGYRFAYSSSAASTASAISIPYWLTDGNGGWSPSGDISGLRTGYTTGGAVFLFYPGATTYLWFRDLTGVTTGYNASAAAGATGGTMAFTALAGDLDASGGDDILIELIAENRSTDAETVVLKLPSTGTPHAGANTSFSDTAAHVVNLNTYRYFIRATSVGTGAGVVIVSDLKLTVSKYAVE